MREIKFRSYDKDKNKMFYETQEDAELLKLRLGASIHNAIWQIGLSNKSLMQFTGLQDKNGKDIYEGDIVSVEKIDGKIYGAQVRFFNGAFCIYTSNLDINVQNVKGYNILIHIDFDWEEYQPFYEVIGNIYDNPELLAVTPKIIS